MSQINDAFGRPLYDPLYDAILGTPPPTWEQTCLKLSEEKRKLQSDVNELKELVEYLQDRIKTLKKAGDDLAKTQTHDLLETINWFKAKDAKP